MNGNKMSLEIETNITSVQVKDEPQNKTGGCTRMAISRHPTTALMMMAICM